ncbi:hypothetical protein GCM10010407_10560 [Rarobacter incanus]
MHARETGAAKEQKQRPQAPIGNAGDLLDGGDANHLQPQNQSVDREDGEGRTARVAQYVGDLVHGSPLLKAVSRDFH